VISSRVAAPVAALALVTTPFALGALAPAYAASSGLVISEVYGGAHNSGAVYTHDYVELLNRGSEPVVLDGLSLQYRSATGTAAASFTQPLSGTVAPGSHYFIRAAAGTAGTTTLPEPDASTGLNLSGTSGTVWIARGASAQTLPTGSVAGRDDVVDLVGFGTSNTFEGAVAAAPSGVTSISRTGADTDANNADFTAGAGTPTRSGATTPTPDPTPTEPPAPTVTSIAAIQGTGATSPLAGQTVTTQGVVTAVYPGRFNGFYLQTAGSGSVDSTPGASDALFVFGRNVDETALAIGDSVRVTGVVGEFQGATQITPAAASDVVASAEPLAAVEPLVAAYPTTAEAREAHEGELVAPTDDFAVTNVYSTNQYAEIGLATGGRPLVQPTEVARPGTPEYAEVVADNAARAVILDDGSSINFLSGADRDIPLPWLTPARSIRVGARATLAAPVILDFRNSTWKLQPTTQVTGDGSEVATFEDTRAANRAPQPVGGDLKLATFNVLNYFNTTGEEFEQNGGTCSYYTDRDQDPVAVNSCNPNGPRGAAEWEDLQRQQAKIVRAINGLGADVVSLEELENSIKLLGETDRDDAIRELVKALNAAAGAGTWRYVPSPAEALTPEAVAQQDVIRTGFIYRPARVQAVGESDLLLDTTEFGNAREPLAQAFKPVGGGGASVFAVVVNHFKSKGCSGATGDNADAADGQGCFNGDRVRQAERLATFAAAFASARRTDKVFLAGDFNSYSEEDPMHALYAAGYSAVESGQADDESYSFSGLSGSLDHVLASPAAAATVTGADIWEINADESIAYQYSRFNYNVTQFFDAGDPFAASDHNPELVGIRTSKGSN
jgi:5'-nucleotidase